MFVPYNLFIHLSSISHRETNIISEKQDAWICRQDDEMPGIQIIYCKKKDMTCHYLTISCLIILTIEEPQIKNQTSS